MNTDKTIEYQAKLIEVTNNIEQLETLEINTDYYKNKVEEIKKETELEIKKQYDSYDKDTTNSLLHDLLAMIYEKSKERLDKINNHIISEYETYYKINGKCKEIENKIKNLDPINIPELVIDAKELLKSIKSSTTIDYDEEQKLVEKIYKVVYEIVKIEIIYSKKDTLLKTLKDDITDVSFISKLIIEESEQLLKKDNNEELQNKLNEINKKGFSDINFLDKDLIILIETNNDNKLIKEMKKNFLKTIDNYENTSFELQQTIDNKIRTEEDIIEIKKKNKIISLKRFGKKIALLLDMALVSAGILLSIKGAKEINKELTYKTITTTYDSSLETNEDPIIEYLPDGQNSVTLVEYTPWEEPGYFRDDYKRTIYTYDLNNIQQFYENPKDYLNPELKELITYTEIDDYSTEIPTDIYEENKYVITHTFQDKTDINETYNKEGWIFLSIAFSGLVLLVNTPLLVLLGKNNLKLQKKENKQLIEENKELLLENNQQIISLKDQLITMRKNLTKEYEELPKSIQEDKSVKKRMLVLENKQNND